MPLPTITFNVPTDGSHCRETRIVLNVLTGSAGRDDSPAATNRERAVQDPDVCADTRFNAIRRPNAIPEYANQSPANRTRTIRALHRAGRES